MHLKSFMSTNDMVNTTQEIEFDSIVSAISGSCQQFINESEGLPLFKTVPTPALFSKQKVRFKKRVDDSEMIFNEAFVDQGKNISTKALFVSSNPEDFYDSVGSLHYIFPVDGYSYLYETNDLHAPESILSRIDQMTKQLDGSRQLIVDSVRYVFDDRNLTEAIENKKRVVLYNIPLFYSINCDSMSYSELTERLSQ